LLDPLAPIAEVRRRVRARVGATSLREEDAERNDVLLGNRLLPLPQDLQVEGVLEDRQDEGHAPAHVLLSDGWSLQHEHVVRGEAQALVGAKRLDVDVRDRLYYVTLP